MTVTRSSPGGPSGALPEVVELDAHLSLEDLVDRNALGELCRSVYVLFGIPVRVYSAAGGLVAGEAPEHEVCAYVNTLASGRRACGSTVDAVKAKEPGEAGDVVHPCFTGQQYRVFPIDYEGRRIGRVILGPYAPPAIEEVPASLTATLPEADRPKVKLTLAKVPRAKPESITRIATHLLATLDLVMFSGHKALVTSTMHVASVKESYRELSEKNAKLQGAYDRLRELDRLKSNFLATVSHELKTPLTSIIGYSEMLAEGLTGELTAEQKEFVTTIHDKGHQLLELITGLLDLSKLESGTMTLRRRLTEIHPVLLDVESTVKPVAMKRGVKVAFDLEQRSCELLGDPERLRQVFINLVDNAMKFTPRGGTVTVESRVVEDALDNEEDSAGFALLAPMDRAVVVRVIDTGPGIPEAERAKVFDAFYQVDSSSTREHGGTGLGLSIVRRLVEGHGGSVSIEANSPKGAVFVVRLPSSNNPRAQRSSLPPPLPPPSTEP